MTSAGRIYSNGADNNLLINRTKKQIRTVGNGLDAHTITVLQVREELVIGFSIQYLADTSLSDASITSRRIFIADGAQPNDAASAEGPGSRQMRNHLRTVKDSFNIGMRFAKPLTIN